MAGGNLPPVYGRPQMAPGTTGSQAYAAAHAPGFGSVLGALSDMITGAGRGAFTTALGWPGDLEQLGAQGLAHFGLGDAPSGLGAPVSQQPQATLWPTSKDVSNFLPPSTSFSIPADKNVFSDLGMLMPLSPGQLARGAAAVGRPAVRGALGAVRGALGAVRGALGAVHDAMQGGDGLLSRALAPVAPAWAVKPRGGNFEEASLPAYFGEGLGLTGAPGATNTWANKQLKNLQNTGLVGVDAASDLAKYLGPQAPRYMAQDELTKSLQDMRNAKGLGYAHGGSVKSAPRYSKKAALLARLQG